MPKLHELTAAYNHLDALIDDTEMTNEQLVTFVEAIEGAISEKSENIAKLIENLETTSESMKAAEAKLATRRKAVESRVKAIKGYLLGNMINSGIQKIECEYFKISVRDNPPTVIVDDQTAIPREYMKQPEPPPQQAPDKKKILDDWKQGVVIDGVRIEQGKRLEIR